MRIEKLERWWNHWCWKKIFTENHHFSWRSINYSAIGTKHERQGLPCQDYSNYRCYDDVLIGAVADGAGSAKHSDIGAQLAVETTLSFLSGTDKFQTSPRIAKWCEKKGNKYRLPKAQITQRISHKIHDRVLKALTEQAELIECQVADLACTLLVFMATPHWFAAMQVGDGFLVVRSPEGQFQLLFAPNKGEFPNQTTFITCKAAKSHLQCKTLPRQAFICAASDGLENVAIDASNGKPFPPFFTPLEECLQEDTSREEKEHYLQAFLESKRLNQKTSDDKTLLIACSYNQ